MLSGQGILFSLCMEITGQLPLAHAVRCRGVLCLTCTRDPDMDELERSEYPGCDGRHSALVQLGAITRAVEVAIAVRTLQLRPAQASPV